jgi:hypothetical protein
MSSEPPAPRPRRDSLRFLRESFDWKWTLLGTAIMVGGAAALYQAGRSILTYVLNTHGALAGAGLMAGSALLIYFLGGLLVGRMSSGKTIKEPAVAGVLALLIITGLQLKLGMINIIGLVLGAPLCFGVAYLGGLLGEKWQRGANRSR